MKLKRISSPGTWMVKRKHGKWITDPVSGFKRSESLPLTHVLQELGVCKTAREVKKLVSERKVLVDGRKVKSHKQGVGLFDVVSLIGEKTAWRLVYSSSQKLSFIECKDADKIILRVENKKLLTKSKGFQLNLSGGFNIVSTKKNISPGDSVLVSIPDLKIVEHFKSSKGSLVYVVGGAHKGSLARVMGIKKFESSQPDIYTLKTKDSEFNTRKSSVYVIGSEKEAIALR